MLPTVHTNSNRIINQSIQNKKNLVWFSCSTFNDTISLLILYKKLENLILYDITFFPAFLMLFVRVVKNLRQQEDYIMSKNLTKYD